MAYNPGVTDRSGEILAQGISQGFSSLARGVELGAQRRKENEDLSKKAKGSLAAYGQTIKGMVSAGIIPESALADLAAIQNANSQSQIAFVEEGNRALSQAINMSQLQVQRDAAASTSAYQTAQAASQAANEARNKALYEQSLINATAMGAALGVGAKKEFTERRTVSVPKYDISSDLNNFSYKTYNAGKTSGVQTVEVVPPDELRPLLYKDTLNNEYRILSDQANAILKDQEDKVSALSTLVNKQKSILNNEVVYLPEDTRTLNPNADPSSRPSNRNASPYRRPNLTDTERADLMPAFEAQSQMLEEETKRLADTKAKVASAYSFGGTPLFEKRVDPIVSAGVKILKLPALIAKKTVIEQQSLNRPFTEGEQAGLMIKAYTDAGGKPTMELLNQFREATKAPFQFVDLGSGMNGVLVGKNLTIVPTAKTPSASILNRNDKETYQIYLNAAAKFGFDALTPEMKQKLVSLNAVHGADVVDVFGNKSKIYVNEAIKRYEREIGGLGPKIDESPPSAASSLSGTGTRISGSTPASNFTVTVVKPN